MVKIVIGRVLTAATDSVTVPGVATEATLAGIKTGTDKIPASPAQEHTTFGSPHAVRLSDGTAFYRATTPAETQPVAVVAHPSALPLPAGAATEATLATRATEATLATKLSKGDFEARVNTLGQKTKAASMPVVLASDQDKLPVGERNTLVPFEHDTIELVYTGNNLTTVRYRTGGLAGTIVATLALAYTGARLDSVVRT